MSGIANHLANEGYFLIGRLFSDRVSMTVLSGGEAEGIHRHVGDDEAQRFTHPSMSGAIKPDKTSVACPHVQRKGSSYQSREKVASN